MNKVIRVLIVDDHPMTVMGYEMILVNSEVNYYFVIECAYSCEEVLEKMKGGYIKFYDVVLLDIRLPPSLDGFITSGEDLGERIKQNFPKTKIIVHTALNDLQRILDIFKTFNPEGFLIKTDINSEVLIEAVNSVLNGHSYYSQRAKKIIGNNHIEKIYIDSLNRKILYYLSIGELTKNLPKHVPMAMATIERRKKKLKILFDIPEGNDKQLLDIAREKGYI